MTKSFSLFAFFVFGICFAQTNDNLLNPSFAELVPNSPEAAAFMKYGDVSVSLYTGTPEISIPLYTITGREMQFPISLAYDASGIKVSQIASWAGLGWNLQAGGAVTRQVKGLPDDGINVGYSSIYSSYARSQINYDLQTPLNSVHETMGQLINSYLFYKNIHKQEVDVLPDIFSFNVNGFSGSFFIDYDTYDTTGTAININASDLKAEYETETASGGIKSIIKWTITDPSGVKYEFSQPEVTSFAFENDVNKIDAEYNSSWLLTKVYSRSGKDILEFQYTQGDFWATNVNINSGATIKNMYSHVNVDNFVPIESQPEILVLPVNKHYKIKQPYLASIDLNGHEIINIQTESNQRLDLPGRKALKEIEVKDYQGGCVNLIKLTTSYFDTSGYHPNAHSWLKYKLKLDGVQIESCDNSEIKDYQLDYIEDHNIPAISSNSVDFWGYYNGVNNPHLVPSYTQGNITLTGANREPNFDYAKNGTLKEITYPTGGKTMFSYQSHSLRPRSTSSTIFYNQPIGSVSGGVDYNDAYNYLDCDHNNEFGNAPIGESTAFIVEEDGSFDMTFNVTDACQGGCTQEGYIGLFIYRIADDFDCEGSNSNMTCTTNAQADRDYCDLITDGDYTGFWIPMSSHSTSVSLERGVYGALLLNGDTNYNISASIRLKKRRTSTSRKKVGGFRIYKNEDYSKDYDLAKTKYYYYDDASVATSVLNDISLIPSTPASSAILQQETRYHDYIHENTYRWCTTQTPNHCDGNEFVVYLVRYSDDINPSVNTHIGYSKVSEIIVNKNNVVEDGVSVYEFYNDKLTYSNREAYVNDETNNGKLNKVRFYDKDFTLLRQEENKWTKTSLEQGVFEDLIKVVHPRVKETYLGGGGWECTKVWEVPDGSDLDYKLLDVRVQPCLGTGPNGLPFGACENPCDAPITFIFGAPHYDFDNKTHYIGRFDSKYTQKIVKEYFDGIEIVTTTNYFYDSPLHNQPTRVITTTRDVNGSIDAGETSITKTKYAQDMPSSSVIDALIAANRIAEPIETETYLADANGANEELLSKQKTRYFNSNGLILPRFIQTLKGGQSGSLANLETRINYNSYDSYGNPTDVSQANGTRISYIWGYNGQYPVAKIENSSYTNLPTTERDAIIATSNDPLKTEQDLLDDLQDLRDALPDAMVSTYTYKPLIGVNTMIDPRGYLMTYHYDEFNRLEYVEDQDGKILSKNEYNYRGY